MLDEAFRVIQDEDGIAIVINGERRPVYAMKGDILDVLAEIAAENPPEEGLDLPLPAAGMGYLSYEFAPAATQSIFRNRKTSLKSRKAPLLWDTLL